MFRLVKILHSGVNVPEPMRVTLSTPATAPRGTLFILSEGAMVPVTGSAESIPTHLLLVGVEGETEILCTPITAQTVFEVTVDGDPSAMIEGKEYLLSADGKQLTPTAATGSARGAYLFDKCGAHKAGDEMLVTFPIR